MVATCTAMSCFATIWSRICRCRAMTPTRSKSFGTGWQEHRRGLNGACDPAQFQRVQGVMFPDVTATATPLDADYAATRANWEPLIEMMQIKGNSEVHRDFWAADEFADFENGDSIQKNSDRCF